MVVVPPKGKTKLIQRAFSKSACLRCSIPFTYYQDRSEKLNLRTLEYRRLVFDIILTFIIINDLSDIRFSGIFRNLRYSIRESNLKIGAITKYKTTHY